MEHSAVGAMHVGSRDMRLKAAAIRSKSICLECRFEFRPRQAAYVRRLGGRDRTVGVKPAWKQENHGACLADSWWRACLYHDGCRPATAELVEPVKGLGRRQLCPLCPSDIRTMDSHTVPMPCRAPTGVWQPMPRRLLLGVTAPELSHGTPRAVGRGVMRLPGWETV